MLGRAEERRFGGKIPARPDDDGVGDGKATSCDKILALLKVWLIVEAIDEGKVKNNIIYLSFFSLEMPAMVPNQIVSEHGRLNEGNRGGSEFDQNDLLQRDTCTNYPQYQLQLQHFVAPLMHPLASPSKRLKVLHDDASPHYNEPWSQSSVHHPTLASSPLPLPVNTGSSPLTIDPPVVREQLPTSALARNTASDSSISVENPYSTSRGLRQFSMKVCEKVEEKGTTTYNEVADEVSHFMFMLTSYIHLSLSQYA